MSDHQRPDESVSALLRAASGPATADELAGADAAVARFVDVVLSDTPAAPPVISQPVDAPPVVVEPEKAQPARRLRSVPVPARAAGIIAAVTLWSTGMAAAATGNLPDPVQHAVSNTAAHVGLSIPDPSDDVTVQANEHKKNEEDDDTTTSSSSSSSTTGSSTTSPPTTTATSTRAGGGAALAPTTSADDDEAVDGEHGGQGPDANGPAHDGLCNAYLRGLANGNPKDPAVPPWRNLLDAATKAGKSIEQFCGVTTSTTASTAAAAATTAAPATTSATTSTSTTIENESEGDENGGGNGSGGGNNGSAGTAPNGVGQGPGNNNGQGNGADGSNAHGGNPNSSADGS